LIRPFIDDPDEPLWSLLPDERRRLIAAADSLELLRSAHDPAADPGPAGSTVSRILAGSPFDLAGVPDEELPYWLQAVSWFAPVVPGLPAAADVHRELQARRVRGRLRVTATPRLWGREAELETLRRWFAGPEPPPMIVTGIGGMGKSALVARFALDLPPDTVILWLDFDRADLAPDNAVSVLTTLVEQLAVQRAGFTPPPVDEASWPAAAWALSTSLSGAGALLVLDGFEVAQHVRRHEELWGVLNTVIDRAADTRVVVSGRAPVPDLRLGHRVAATLPLTGLPPEAVRAWLLERGIEEPAVLDAVLRLADGVPLLLKLAVRLVQAGDGAPDVLRRLPRELVAGYLYQRILDRVVDLRLRQLAHGASARNTCSSARSTTRRRPRRSARTSTRHAPPSQPWTRPPSPRWASTCARQFPGRRSACRSRRARRPPSPAPSSRPGVPAHAASLLSTCCSRCWTVTVPIPRPPYSCSLASTARPPAPASRHSSGICALVRSARAGRTAGARADRSHGRCGVRRPDLVAVGVAGNGKGQIGPGWAVRSRADPVAAGRQRGLAAGPKRGDSVQGRGEDGRQATQHQVAGPLRRPGDPTAHRKRHEPVQVRPDRVHRSVGVGEGTAPGGGESVQRLATQFEGIPSRRGRLRGAERYPVEPVHYAVQLGRGEGEVPVRHGDRGQQPVRRFGDGNPQRLRNLRESVPGQRH